MACIIMRMPSEPGCSRTWRSSLPDIVGMVLEVECVAVISTKKTPEWTWSTGRSCVVRAGLEMQVYTIFRVLLDVVIRTVGRDSFARTSGPHPRCV